MIYTPEEFRAEMLACASRCNAHVAHNQRLADSVRIAMCMQSIAASICACIIGFPFSIAFSIVGIAALIAVRIVTIGNDKLAAQWLEIRNQAMNGIYQMEKELRDL